MAVGRLTKRLLDHPLTHFLLLGAGLVALDVALRDDADAEDERVDERAFIVEADRLEALREHWQERAGRAPTEAEWEEVVQAFVTDEVPYREALARGMHDGDLKNRRRLVKKMRYLLGQLAQTPPQTEAETAAAVDALMESQPKRYPADDADSRRRARGDLVAERRTKARQGELRCIVERYEVRRRPCRRTVEEPACLRQSALP